MSGEFVINLYGLREFALGLLDATHSNLEGEFIPERFREAEWEIGKAKVALNIANIYARCIEEIVKGEKERRFF